MADAILVTPTGTEPPADSVRGLAPPWYTLVFLPYGTTTGFITITLSYILAHHGVSFPAIAGVVGLYLLPSSLCFMLGPILDICLTSKRWYLLSVAVGTACLLALGLAPLTPQSIPVLSALSLICGVAFTAAINAATAAMTLTTPVATRAKVSGWIQVGTYSGVGAGGGAGLWLVTNGVGQSGAAIILSILSVLCVAPVLWMRVPRRPAGLKVAHQTLDLGRALWQLVTTRAGILTVLVQTMPAGLGTSFHLMAGLAGEWKADAGLVALMMGGLSALVSIPGCIFGGYLCAKITSKAGYVAVSLVLAASGTLMALGPHTPIAFAVQILGNNFLLGIAVTTCQAVLYEFLDDRATATMASVLYSLNNLPVVVMTFLVGWAQARYGTTEMMLLEAAVGVFCVVGYAALAWHWRVGAAAPKAATSEPVIVSSAEGAL
jgi:MFS transporter, PAT family, beta-lactamase induction signal transducer AmpG